MGTPDAGAARAAVRRQPAAVVGGLAAVYLALIGFVLEPRTFFAGDPGVKYLQARSMVDSGWRQLSVGNPAPDVDPDAQFSALACNQFERRTALDPYYGAYSVLFTVPVSICLWAFGPRGLYVVPMLATLGTLVLTYQLALRTAPRLAWLAALLAGATSPLAFYSLDLWEHSLSAFCVTASVLLFLGATGKTTTRRCFAAGLLLGVAVDLREELYGLIPLALVAVFWIEPGRRLAAALAAAGGVLLAAVPQWLLRSTLMGVPLRKITLRAMTGTARVPAIRTAAVSWSAQVGFIVPVSWGAVLAVAASLRWAAAHGRPAWRRAALSALAAIVVVLAVGDALYLIGTWTRPDALLAAFPAALLLLFWPPRDGHADPARSEAALLVTLSLGFALLVAVVEPFGSSIVPIGGSQFGPRYLLPIIPLLATAVTYVVDRRDAWSAAGMPRSAIAIVAAIVTLAGATVQLQGVRDLRVTKAGYERLIRATEAIPDGQPVVTDVSWYPAVTASVLFQHESMVVNVPETGTVTALLARPGMAARSALVFVTDAHGPSPETVQALEQAGWREVSRQRVALWRDLDFVGFARRS